MATSPLRARAILVVALLVAALLLALLLLLAFDPEVQTIPAAELADRRDDARAFRIGDYVFVLLYAVLSPIAIWRFARALPAVVFLAAAGIVDATENTLLLSATGSVDEGAVDAAHALALPKFGLFAVGAVLALIVHFRAVRTLRRGESR